MQITVCVKKYDGSEHRRWPAVVTSQNDSLIVLKGEFESEVEHELLGNIRCGTRTVEYFWLDRWYNIFRFLEADGTTKLFYCNVGMPPSLSQGTLTYIDLDIDVLVRPDGTFTVLDREEFDANAELYEYPDEVKRRAHLALDELISMIETHQFPFTEANPVIIPGQS